MLALTVRFMGDHLGERPDRDTDLGSKRIKTSWCLSSERAGSIDTAHRTDRDTTADSKQWIQALRTKKGSCRRTEKLLKRYRLRGRYKLRLANRFRQT